MQPHLLLRKEQIIFFLFARGVQESKSHSLVLGQGDVESFSWHQPVKNFGGFGWRIFQSSGMGLELCTRGRKCEMVHCSW